MAYKPSILEIAAGGSNASTFTQSNGIVVYNGTSLVDYTGPQISSGGQATNSIQSAFCAKLSSQDNNVTGNGTTFRIGSGNAFTERFDQNSDFNTNGTFTAPVTGKYLLTFSFSLNQTTGGSSLDFNIVTSNTSYDLGAFNAVSNLGIHQENSCIIADMDAADTATFTLNLFGVGADTSDVATGGTYVSGVLLC